MPCADCPESLAEFQVGVVGVTVVSSRAAGAATVQYMLRSGLGRCCNRNASPSPGERQQKRFLEAFGESEGCAALRTTRTAPINEALTDCLELRIWGMTIPHRGRMVSLVAQLYSLADVSQWAERPILMVNVIHNSACVFQDTSPLRYIAVPTAPAGRARV